jgi:hypothetical protein
VCAGNGRVLAATATVPPGVQVSAGQILYHGDSDPEPTVINRRELPGGYAVEASGPDASVARIMDALLNAPAIVGNQTMPQTPMPQTPPPVAAAVMLRSAEFSDCEVYRYRLSREWDTANPRRACFCMLNPSTADAIQDDPTIRRCMSFARTWGYGGVQIVNLFAFRSTDPARLFETADPIGPDNNDAILDAADECETIVCAWGNIAEQVARGRAYMLVAMMRETGKVLHCLGKTREGSPRHPLYVKGTTPLEVYAQPESVTNPPRVAAGAPRRRRRSRAAGAAAPAPATDEPAGGEASDYTAALSTDPDWIRNATRIVDLSEGARADREQIVILGRVREYYVRNVMMGGVAEETPTGHTAERWIRNNAEAIAAFVAAGIPGFFRWYVRNRVVTRAEPASLPAPAIAGPCDPPRNGVMLDALEDALARGDVDWADYAISQLAAPRTIAGVELRQGMRVAYLRHSGEIITIGGAAYHRARFRTNEQQAAAALDTTTPAPMSLEPCPACGRSGFDPALDGPCARCNGGVWDADEPGVIGGGMEGETPAPEMAMGEAVGLEAIAIRVALSEIEDALACGSWEAARIIRDTLPAGRSFRLPGVDGPITRETPFVTWDSEPANGIRINGTLYDQSRFRTHEDQEAARYALTGLSGAFGLCERCANPELGAGRCVSHFPDGELANPFRVHSLLEDALARRDVYMARAYRDRLTGVRVIGTAEIGPYTTISTGDWNMISIGGRVWGCARFRTLEQQRPEHPGNQAGGHANGDHWLVPGINAGDGGAAIRPDETLAAGAARVVGNRSGTAAQARSAEMTAAARAAARALIPNGAEGERRG